MLVHAARLGAQHRWDLPGLGGGTLQRPVTAVWTLQGQDAMIMVMHGEKE